MIEGRPCLSHRQAHVAVACTLRREREFPALLAVRVGVCPLAGVGRVGGACGDVADRDGLALEVEKLAVGCILLLAGPSCRADVDGRRAARAVLVWDVEDGQPVAFEGPAATTGWCVPCVALLWRRKRSAYSDLRLGFAQNAAGTAPVSVFFSKLIIVTAGSKAIESGMVPTKRFCWKRLHRNTRGHRIILGRHYVNPMRCDSD